MLYWRDESAQLSFGGKLLSISPDSLWYSHEKNPAIFRWSYQIPSFHTKPRHDVDIRVQNLVFPGEKPQHFTLMAFPRIPLARRSPRLAQAKSTSPLPGSLKYSIRPRLQSNWEKSSWAFPAILMVKMQHSSMWIGILGLNQMVDWWWALLSCIPM